jgi:plasmid stabilization system protein ParE
MRVRFMPEATADADHAADWYAAAEPEQDLDRQFLAEVKRVARLVGERPRAWTEVEPGVRRAVLRRFPYSLIYTVDPDEVLILAVAHHRRGAGYWRDRK